MGIEQFAGTTPSFLPEEFFDGDLEGWGILESPLGGLSKRYTVKATGRWDESNQTVSFTETWTFDDGLAETLNWKIKRLGGGKYSGEEPRLEGCAEGEQAGCAFHWSYTRQTPQANGERIKLNFDDWFYRIDDVACVVRGTAGRMGLPFAIAHVTYRKTDASSEAAPGPAKKQIAER